MRIKSLSVLLFFSISLVYTSSGQQHTFINYSSEEGLPQSQVNSIVQDSSGFLWIATIGGISRFDGKNFKNYSTLNGLLQNEISELAVGKNSNLWTLGTRGLSKFNSTGFINYPFETQLRNLSNLCIDSDTIWFASRSGLKKFYNDSLINIEIKLEIGNRIRYVKKDQDGNLWLLTNTGAYQYSSSFEIVDSLNIPFANKLINSNSDVYLSSFYDGIYANFNPDPIIENDNNGSEIYIKDFVIDKDQKTIWIASDDKLIKWSDNKYTELNKRNGLEYTDINTLFLDSENVLWIGTNGNGLYKYLGDLITTYTTKDGLNSDIIMGVTKLHDVMYALNYTEGINAIVEDTILNYSVFENEKLQSAWSLLSDRDNLYIAYRNAFGIVSDSKSNFFPNDLYFNSSTLNSVNKDELDGSVVIGTNDGFVKLKDDKFKIYNSTNGFPFNDVRMAQRQIDGSLWVSSTKGLYKLIDSTFTSFTQKNGLKSNNIYNTAFYHDKMWIGSSAGLYFIDGDTCMQFHFSDSPQDLSINSLLNDGLGRLWIGTNNGITTLLANGKGEYIITHYGLQNGLRGLAINMNANFVDEEGNVFFGSENGLVRFDRGKLEVQNIGFFPKVHLTDLQLYLKEIDWKKRGDSLVSGFALPIDLRLEPKENYLTFNFAGINTRNPNDVRYRFMLLGGEGELSENWSSPTKNNFATFSNLPSGEYTFKVQSTTTADYWGEHFTSYSFTIKTPYYATWWFRTLLALVVISTFYVIYRARINRLRQEQDNLFLRTQSKMLALEQQTLNANMNRHFVFNALNSIQYYLNKEDKISANRYLSRFAKLIRKNLDSSQSKQTSLSEEIERMVLYMELEQMRFAHKFEFTFNIDPEINTKQVKIPSMLFQPYLENSIWHGILPMDKKGQLDVKITKEEGNSIKISIFDNGIGIETSLKMKDDTPRDHISVGMEITKNRLALYQQSNNSHASVVGPYEIKEDGKTIGTQVELFLPMLDPE